jgi:hypothetical protein
MLTDAQQQFGRIDPSRRRRVRRTGAAVSAAGLAAVLAAAALLAGTASAARPPSGGAAMFTHSAAGGELRDGRLILHRVAGRVTWAHIGGGSGVIAVKPMHRMLFKPGTSATGTLHVAGHHGGDEPTFKLSKPRYNAARRTVSYRARALNTKRVPGGAARAAGAARSFGAASLSMIAASSTGDVVWAPTAGVYTCASGSGICWGTLLVYGLDPGAGVTVTRQWSDGGIDSATYSADQGGFIRNQRLELPCVGFDRHVGTAYFDPDGPELSAPDRCG